MQIVYTLEDLPETINKSLFLAGPTSREGGENSWRKDAIKILEDKGFDGILFIPEARDWGKFDPEYDEQVQWEEKCLNVADCIAFWIPRDLKKLPGLITNDEWGFWKNSGKVVLGTPETAEKVDYQKYYAKDLNVPFAETLTETMQNAIDQIGEGTDRSKGERFVPLYIWNTPSFKAWYKSQTEAGNTLEWAQVLFNFRPQNKSFVFLWILKAHIYVKSEDRIKENEFVIARPDVSSVVMWHRNFDIEKSKIVLVKEFRTPAATKDGFIIELPGGSSKQDKNPILVAVEEIKEETGFSIHPSRFKSHEARQLAGTLSSHKSYSYSVELTEEEIEWFEDQKGTTHGNKEDTEITYIEVLTLKELFKSDIDWSNLGMILSTVYCDK